MKNKGTLISFSGIDGSGKTTFVEELKRYLNNQGFNDVLICDAMKPCTYNDNLKDIAKKLDKNMFEVFGKDLVNITYAIDLIKNLEYSILPALEKGTIVITHRYDLCCKAYSMLSNCDMNIINRILSLCPCPDIHFYIDIDPEISINRIKTRCEIEGTKLADKENYNTLTKARNNYLTLIEKDYKNVSIINRSNEDDKDSITLKIIEKVNKLFNMK